MPRTTKTLKMVSIRVNQPRLVKLEAVSQYALKQGRQLDPMGGEIWVWMLDRFASIEGYLKKIESEIEERRNILGSLK